jgi:hypothetical protein
MSLKCLNSIDLFSITEALVQAVDASERLSLLVLVNSNERHSKKSSRPSIPFTTSITRHVSGLFSVLLPFFLGFPLSTSSFPGVTYVLKVNIGRLSLSSTLSSQVVINWSSFITNLSIWAAACLPSAMAQTTSD